MIVGAQEMRAKSPLLQAVYGAVVSLHGHGFIDTPRLSLYEALCLEPVANCRSAQATMRQGPMAR